MLAQIRKARHEENGFTLIELLMVIVIIGILAGIVVFSVRGINDTGEAAACKADLKTVETAVEAYYASNDSTYPANLAALVPSFLHSEPDGTVTYAAGVVDYTPACDAAIAAAA
jgi:general secretion pathway protein G